LSQARFTEGVTIFIAVEGIDGSGKTTQTKQLGLHLKEEGYSVATIKFPCYDQTFFGGAIADYLNGEFGDLKTVPVQMAAMLFAGDRYEKRSELLELLETNDLVITDRYTASNMAYQAAKVQAAHRDEMLDWICRLEYEVYELPRPDINIFLDLPVDYANRLVRARGKHSYSDQVEDLHESDLIYLADCRSVYQSLAAGSQGGGTWITVLCADQMNKIRDPIDIAGQITHELKPLLIKAGSSECHGQD